MRARRVQNRIALVQASRVQVSVFVLMLAPTHGRASPCLHAHNSYQHADPLAGLDVGACSLEADVFLIGDTWYVGHTCSELTKERTLGKLYLEPLAARARRHELPEPITLLVDIKNEGTATHAALMLALRGYRDVLSHFSQGRFVPGAITVVVSGFVDAAALLRDNERLALLDGRLTDLLAPLLPVEAMPLVSHAWGDVFTWDGLGDAPTSARDALTAMIDLAHAHGRRIRFYSAPDTPELWRLQRELGVDLINTDAPHAAAAVIRDD